jgi:hypothetical protein
VFFFDDAKIASSKYRDIWRSTFDGKLKVDLSTFSKGFKKLMDLADLNSHINSSEELKKELSKKNLKPIINDSDVNCGDPFLEYVCRLFKDYFSRHPKHEIIKALDYFLNPSELSVSLVTPKSIYLKRNGEGNGEVWSDAPALLVPCTVVNEFISKVLS